MANFNARRSFNYATWTLLVLAVGCGAQDRGYLTGRVLLNGEPVGPGTITLQPVNADTPGAMAFFEEDGYYKVVSSGRAEGAAVGEYRVLIDGRTSAEFGAEEVAPQPSSRIPARYSNPRSSDLTVTIEPGSKTVDFDLRP